MTTPAAPAYTSSNRARIIAIGGGVPFAIALISVALMAIWSPELPDPIAIHWDGVGGVNGTGSLLGFAAMTAGIILGFAALATGTTVVLRASSSPVAYPRFIVATSIFLAATLGVGMTGMVAMQRGLVDASAAPSPTLPLLIGAGVGLLLSVAAYFLTPRPRLLDAEDDSVAPTLSLSPDERASWSGFVAPGGGVLAVVGGIILLCIGSLAVGASSGLPIVFVVVFGVLLVLVFVSSFWWRVRVDARGFSARSVLGIPRFRYPLAELTGATVVTVNPTAEFGGWGFRISPGANRMGVVVRTGEAIEVTRASGRSFVATVPDATTAVALLNGLLARR